MKKLFLILSVITVFVNCKKSSTAPSTSQQTCTINLALFKDVVWHPILNPNAFATLTFTSSGEYFQNSTNQGTWTLSNGCDSVYVVRPSITNFYNRILSVTSDTLKITNPTFGEMTYYK